MSHLFRPTLRLPNLRRFAVVSFVAAAAVLPLADARPAWAAQDVPNLSARIRGSEEPVAFRNEIDAFLDYHVSRLLGDDPVAVGQAREALSNQVGDQQATISFKNLYADLLVNRLQRAAANEATFNQLNIAIVAERLARLTGSTRLGPLITTLAEDDDAQVALWAAQAAQPIFPELLSAAGSGDTNRLTRAMVESVKRFPGNGPLAEDVYETLSMRITEARPPSRAVLERGASTVVPALHDLMAFRTGLVTPSAPAPHPRAELPALVLIVHPFTWPVQTQEQKTATVVRLRDLMVRLAETAGNMEGDPRREVIEVLTRIGSGFETISGPTVPNGPPQLPELYPAAQQLRRAPPTVAQRQLEEYVAGIVDALASTYPDLPAPQLASQPDAGGPDTQPTQPAAGGN